MRLDTFFTSADDEVDALLGTVSMTCDGQTFNVVFNDERSAEAGEMGGIDNTVQAYAVAQTADVSNPRALKRKRATVDGRAYRITEVVTGSVSTQFSLVDPDS